MATGFPFQLKRIFASALLLSLFASLSPAPGEEPARRMGLILGGTFEGAEITRTPSGSQKTVLIASYEWDYGVRYFTEKTWSERNLTWETFLAAAEKVADEILENLEPELVRDERGIIEYAILNNEDPFLSSVLISPGLLDRFRESLGDRLQAIVIDRQMIYLFPATGGKMEAFGQSLVEAYQKAKFPVSLEVFLIDEKGARIIGEIGDGEG